MKEKAEFDQQMVALAEMDEDTSKNILEEWDSDDGLCSSRSHAKTCKRVGKLFLFLVCFFGLLILFSAGVMILFNYVFNGKRHEEEPQISEIKVPELIYEPKVDSSDSLVYCRYNDFEIRPYVKRMNSFIKHLNPTSVNSQDCNDNVTKSTERPCRFDMSQLGNVCVKKRKFGFDDCRLCIALTLEKVVDWQPIAYDNESVPMEIRDRYDNNAVTVSCHGLQPADDENMGPVAYYPPEGFHFKYFPYQEQEGYNTPLVMIHFKNPSKFVQIVVECKAWAKNIVHAENEGIVTFKMYLE